MSSLMAGMLDLSTLKKNDNATTASQEDFDSMTSVQAQGRAHEGRRRREYKVSLEIFSDHLYEIQYM